VFSRGYEPGRLSASVIADRKGVTAVWCKSHLRFLRHRDRSGNFS
jgi:hypothetical protein